MYERSLPSTPIFEYSIELFLLLCERRSFSDVARVVGCTQSFVSKHVSDLEHALQVRLFDRTQRPIVPTPQGRVLYAELKAHVAALEETVEQMKLRSSVLPVVRIGCVESLSAHLVPSLIAALKGASSQMLQITATSNFLLRLLMEYKLDVIISCDPFLDVGRLHRRFLFQEPSLLMLSKEMACAKKSWGWSDLQLCGKPYIYYHLESGGGRLNERYLSAQYLKLPNKIEVDTNTVMVSLVAKGIGWTISRASTVMQTSSLISDVVAVPMLEPALVRRIYLITRADEDRALADLCYRQVVDIIAREIRPKLEAIAPWAEDKFVFAPDEPDGTVC